MGRCRGEDRKDERHQLRLLLALDGHVRLARVLEHVHHERAHDGLDRHLLVAVLVQDAVELGHLQGGEVTGRRMVRYGKSRRM